MLLFMDGLDCYADVNDVLNSPLLARTQSSTPDFSTSLGRFGGGAFVNSSSINTDSWRAAQAFSLNTVYFVGASVYVSGLPNSGNAIFLAIHSSTGSVLISVRIGSDGSVLIGNASGSTTSMGGAGTVTPSSWYRFELKFNLGTSTATGGAELHMNGVSLGSVLSSQNYYNADGGSFFACTMVSNSTAPWRFDDLVIWDDTGSFANTWLGDVRIDAVPVASDTAEASWLPDTGSTGYTQIDDAANATDGNVSYIESSTPGDKSEFGVSPLAGVSTSVLGVQARIRAIKSDPGTRTYKGYIKSGSTTADGDTKNPGGVYFADYNGLWSYNPDGSIAWDDASVAALKLGVELVS